MVRFCCKTNQETHNNIKLIFAPVGNHRATGLVGRCFLNIQRKGDDVFVSRAKTSAQNIFERKYVQH